MKSIAVVPCDGMPYSVQYNRRSVIFSIFMAFNVLIMPLKAYISEPFPWTPRDSNGIPWECYQNFTHCSPILFNFFKNASSMVTKQNPYISNNVYDIIRLPLLEEPNPANDPIDYYLNMPYALFYCQEHKELAFKFAVGKLNATDFAGTEMPLFLTSAIMYNAIWIENPEPHSYIAYICSARAATSLWWQVLKLVYRLFLSLYLASCMWYQYYRYYSQLKVNLEQFGLPNAPRGTKFTIIVGDPTSLILANGLISIAFIMDFWMSTDFVARAFVRLGQLEDLLPFLIACLYLSRTIWFAYGTLIATSFLFKRLGKETSLHTVDPTLTATAVLIAAGPFTYIQTTHIEFLISLYNYLAVCAAQLPNMIEISIAAILYTILIGGLPLLAGLRPTCLYRNKKRGKPRERTRDRLIYVHNDIKTRWAMHLSLFSWKKTKLEMKGGELRGFLQKYPRYRRVLGISQTGSDCYILYQVHDTLQGLRLSLFQCVDVKPPLQVIPASSPTAVGVVDGLRIIQATNNLPWIRHLTHTQAELNFIIRAIEHSKEVRRHVSSAKDDNITTSIFLLDLEITRNPIFKISTMFTPAVVPLSMTHYTVRFNRRSLIFSVFMAINVFTMPLKAYISEPFPWSPQDSDFIPSDCNQNFARCGPVLLDYLKNQSLSMSEASPYKSNNVFDLLRLPLNIQPNTSYDPTNFFLSMPYALFYCRDHKELALKLGAGLIKPTDFYGAEMSVFFNAPIAYNAVWIENPVPHEFFIFNSTIRATTSLWWQVLKLLYRLTLSFYLASCMWYQYYRYYAGLKHNLEQLGLPQVPAGTKFTIIVGDPTSLILSNEVNSIAFIVDFWMSVDFVALAFFRVAQIKELVPFLIACLYLSRTLWFAYGTLLATSRLLKRLRMESNLHSVDPTLTAFAVIIAAGPATYLQTNIDFLATLYNYLCAYLIHASDKIEISAAAILYTLLIGGLPLLIGLRPNCRHSKRIHLVKPLEQKTIRQFFYTDNDIKTRWAMHLSLFSWKKTKLEMNGGELREYLTHHPQYQRVLGISQRSSDCYILYRVQDIVHGMRLSLTQCIHLKPPLEIIPAKTPSAVGILDGHRIIQAHNDSPWIM